MADDGNGNGHGDPIAAVKRIETLEPHPHLLGLGLKPHHIHRAGWRVETLAERHAHYGLPAEAADCEAWFIPYRHPANGRVAFERARLIDPADIRAYGEHHHPHPHPLAIYDPLDSLSRPADSILLIAGEEATVAADVLAPGRPVVGMAPNAPLTERMALELAHIPVVFLWLGGTDLIESHPVVQSTATRLLEAGVQEVRVLPPSAGLDAADTLRELGLDRGIEVLYDMLHRAEAFRDAPGDDWPLIPDPTPPRFPLHALPKTIREFVQAVAVNTQTPVDMAAVTALGVLATAAMPAHVDVGAWDERTLGLYILGVSPTGEGKSAVLNAVAAPLRQIASEMRAENAALKGEHESRKELLEIRKSALTGRAKTMAKSAPQIDEDEQEQQYGEIQKGIADLQADLEELGEYIPRQLLTDDATPEALARLMSKNPEGIGVASAEAAVVKNILGHYSDQGKANLDAVCKAANGEGPIWVDRSSGEPLYIERPLLTITLLAQPFVLRNVLEHTQAEDQGLIGRFLFADLEPVSLLGARDHDKEPPRVPVALEEAWAKIVRRVRRSCAPPKPPQPPFQGSGGGFGGFGGTPAESVIKFSLSSSSKKNLRRLRGELEPRLRASGDLRGYADWIQRHAGRIGRMATFLHLAEFSPEAEVDRVSMERALEIGDYFLQHMLIARVAPDPLVRRALKWLQRPNVSGPISQRDIQHGPLNYRGTAADAAALARKLVKSGALKPVLSLDPPGPAGGRPKGPRYEINPSLRKGRQ